MPGFSVSGSLPPASRPGSRSQPSGSAYPQVAGRLRRVHVALLGRRHAARFIIAQRPRAGVAIRPARLRADPRWAEPLHHVAARTVQSHWHRRLSADAQHSSQPREGYWLYPFRAYRTFCPYLVGSYREVAEQLVGYFDLGIGTVILDVPETEDDLHHARLALELAEELRAGGPLLTARPERSNPR